MEKCLGVRYVLVNTKKMPASRVLHELMSAGLVQAVPVRTEFDNAHVFVVGAEKTNKTTLRKIAKEKGWV